MAKKLAIIFGVIFVLVGLLGFVSNPLVGANGIFQTNTIHNLAHIIIGVIMLLMAGSAANMALKLFGVIYLLLAIYGFFVGSGRLLGLVQVNPADNWLHLVLGILLVWFGMMGGKKSPMMPSSPQM